MTNVERPKQSLSIPLAVEPEFRAILFAVTA